MLSSLCKGVVKSILEGHFDEKLCSTIERTQAPPPSSSSSSSSSSSTHSPPPSSSSSSSSSSIPSTPSSSSTPPIHTSAAATAPSPPHPFLHLLFDATDQNFAVERLSERQLSVYLTFLHRFVLSFGEEHVVPWWRHVVLHERNFRTRDLELRRVVKSLVQDLMARDLSVRKMVFEMYFSAAVSSSATSNSFYSFVSSSFVRTILVGFAELQMKMFFVEVEPYLSSSVHRLTAVHLLAAIVHRQGPRLYEIANTPTFSLLLHILTTVQQVEVVSITLWTLIMLLPNLLPFLPAALPQLFVILKRLLLWGIETEPRIDNSPSNDDSSIATTTTSSSSAFCSSSSEKQAERHSQQGRSLASRDNDYKYSGGTILEAPIPPPPPELGRALSVYFHHLYGMFPCNLVAFIRKQRHESYFQHRIRPLVTPLPLNPALLTSTKKGELTLERWKNKEPHSIVTQSMGEYYYQYKGKMDEFKRLHAHYPSDDSLKRALATSPVEKRKQQNNSIIDDEEEAEKQNDESIEEASKKDQAWLQEVEKVCNEIDAELSAAASIVNITDLNSIRTTDLTEERTEERESREGLKNKTKFTRHSFPVVGKRLNNKLSDSLFSNELGLKILQLQSLLERHLELGVAIDPWQGETDGPQQHTQARQDGRRAATATTTTIASHVADPNQVMKEYLVLHNELLFERYLRQQFLRRLGTLQKDSIAILSAEAKYFAASNQVQTQYELLRQMHDLLLQRQQEISLLKQSHRAQTEELLKKMNALFDENRNMSEELHALRLQVEYANDNLERSTLKLAEKTNAVLQLRTKVEDLSSRLRQQDDLQKRITALNEELILWDQLHQKKQREREREENEKEKEIEMEGTSQHQPRRRKESISGSYSERERTKQLLEQRGDLVTSLHEQLDQANDKYQHCQGQLFELRQRLAQLEKEKEERESLSTSQKQLLSYQQQVSIAKIKSIEGKYETIKKINLALENHILRLQTQLEILQQQLQQARRKISLSSLASSSITTIERTTEPEGVEEREQIKGGGIVRKRNQRSRTWMSSPSLLGEVELLQNEDGEEEEETGGDESLSSFTMERRSYAPSSTTTTTDSTRSNSLRSRSSLEEDEMRRRREESGLKTQRGAAQRE